MAERKLGVSFLTFERMRRAADDFLAQYHPDGRIPVPIEEIVELGMRLSIEVRPLLLENFGAEAFITKELDAIYVDANIFLHPVQNRYRSGLAHEVGHLILHKEIIKQTRFETVAEWKQVQREIPQAEYDRLEFQAYTMAGLILVPTDQFLHHYNDLASQAPDYPNVEPLIRDEIYTQLADEFSVSVEVIERRVKYDSKLRSS